MRIVIQRSLGSRLSIDGELFSEAGAGLMILVGVETGDTEADAEWLADKALGMRIFNDDAGVMNRSVLDVGGDVISVPPDTTWPSGCMNIFVRFSTAPCPSLAHAENSAPT